MTSSLAPPQFTRLSGSSKLALGWAQAAARVRERTTGRPAVGDSDLLIGLLLAHPHETAEPRALLAHFRLTARDLLPPAYPGFTVEALRRSIAGIGKDSSPELTEEAAAVIQVADRMASGKRVHVRHILGAFLEGGASVTEELGERLRERGTDLSRLSRVYHEWMYSYDPDAAGGRKAGGEIAAMLLRELPLRPMDVPRYAADRVTDGSDLIGIAGEVDAFALLLASKALTPPLAIGLFGDWGSGKSFFMNAVRNRVATLHDPPASPGGPEPSMFWPSVCQIEFNAWQYVQGSLWASLLEHILERLEGVPLKRIEARRRGVEQELGAATKEKERQDKALKRLEKELAQVEKKLKAAEVNREEALEAAEKERAAAVEEAVGSGRNVVRDLLGTQRAQIIGADADALLTALDDARAETNRGRLLLGRFSMRDAVLAAVGVAVLIPLVAFVLDRLNAPAVVTLLGALSVVIPVATASLKAATDLTRARLDRIEQAKADVEARLAERLPRIDADVQAARATVDEKQRELDRAEAARTRAEEKADTLDGRLKELTPARVLGEFIQERSRSDDYRKHLGLLGVVREDLRELEDLVRRNNADPTAKLLEKPPPNRIILYIDDLDRCSPAKVLEVLEAVHLLLAFDLFVVVVAVDERWLSHALSTELAALQPSPNGGRKARPRDYLEKIFQLPFWVQPMLPDGRRALVRGLLEGSVAVNGEGEQHEHGDGDALKIGTVQVGAVDAMLASRSANPRVRAQQLALRADELAFLESLAPLLGETPRRVKRFVNSVQLLMAMPSSNEASGPPPGRLVVAFVAAVHAGLPDLARPLFKAIDAAADTAPLQSIVADLANPPADEADRLREWFDVPAHKEWRELEAMRLKPRLDIVSRLGFEREGVHSR
jgi:hypothetical protein